MFVSVGVRLFWSAAALCEEYPGCGNESTLMKKFEAKQPRKHLTFGKVKAEAIRIFTVSPS